MRVIARLNGSFDFYNYLQTIRYLIRSAELNHLKSSKRFNKVVEIAIPHTISEKFRVNKIKLCTVCFVSKTSINMNTVPHYLRST